MPYRRNWLELGLVGVAPANCPPGAQLVIFADSRVLLTENGRIASPLLDLSEPGIGSDFEGHA